MMSIAKIWDFFIFFLRIPPQALSNHHSMKIFQKLFFFKLLPHMKLHIFPKFTAVCIMRSKFCE